MSLGQKIMASRIAKKLGDVPTRRI